MTGPCPERILRAALAGLVPPPLREHVEGDPPTDAEIAATKETILARLDGDGRVATYWQLVDALEADHYTIRIALEELHDERRVLPAAVFWRPDRVLGSIGLRVANRRLPVWWRIPRWPTPDEPSASVVGWHTVARSAAQLLTNERVPEGADRSLRSLRCPRSRSPPSGRELENAREPVRAKRRCGLDATARNVENS